MSFLSGAVRPHRKPDPVETSIYEALEDIFDLWRVRNSSANICVRSLIERRTGISGGKICNEEAHVAIVGSADECLSYSDESK